jgi:hypothetical protein
MTARTERAEHVRLIMVNAGPTIASGVDIILADALDRDPAANLTAELDKIFAAGVIATIDARRLPRADSNPDEDA